MNGLKKNVKKVPSPKLTNSGITLIALVVTIIVLLILAGISILMLTGDNGILTKAGEAKEKTDITQIDEQRRLATMVAATNLTETEFQGVKIPAGFAPTMIEGESTKEEGLVITDSTGNEFVWIEVPNKTKDPTATFGPDYEAYGVTDKSDYGNIEKAIYNKSNIDDRYDKWYDSNGKYEEDTNSNLVDRNGCGLTAEEYRQAYQESLTNIYENQGFWLGRYEAGIEESYRYFDSSTTTEWKEVHPAVEKPVIKKNAYPYNWVTIAQAQRLSSEIYSGNRKSGLMFYIHYISLRNFLTYRGDWGTDDKAIIRTYLRDDGGSWGNFYDSLYNIDDDRAHYSLDKGANWLNGKYEKKEDAAMMLSTRSIRKI